MSRRFEILCEWDLRTAVAFKKNLATFLIRIRSLMTPNVGWWGQEKREMG